MINLFKKKTRTWTWKDLLSKVRVSESFHYYDNASRAITIFFEVNKEIPSTWIYRTGDGSTFSGTDIVLGALKREFKLTEQHCISHWELGRKDNIVIEKMCFLLIARDLYILFCDQLQGNEYSFIIFYSALTPKKLIEKIKEIILPTKEGHENILYLNKG